VAPPAADPPWHPFERPAWEDPSPFSPDQPPEFVEWQSEPPPPATARRRTALLGGLAAAAVVALLVVVGILIVRSNRSATPDDSSTAPVTSTGTLSAASTPASASEAPPVTVTVTSETTPSTVSETSSPETSTSAGTDPLGGPVQDIACAPGYIVQIASGLDQDSFVNRIAELRAAGQVPDNAFVANTASSCAIFTSQTNTIVLYAGPFTGPYDGCDARLKAAPDSFIKGTTPETSKDFISCLCPTSAATLPPLTAINQTGVWVGELQRVLGNKLNLDIPDLGADTWGVYTAGTSGAVGQFQGANGLPVTGAVDAATWAAMQSKACS
jgi:Putative peptidoglycan binding domain